MVVFDNKIYPYNITPLHHPRDSVGESSPKVWVLDQMVLVGVFQEDPVYLGFIQGSVNTRVGYRTRVCIRLFISCYVPQGLKYNFFTESV